MFKGLSHLQILCRMAFQTDLLLLIGRQLLSIRIHEFLSKFPLDVTIESKSVEHRFQLLSITFYTDLIKTAFQLKKHFIFSNNIFSLRILVRLTIILGFCHISLRIFKENEKEEQEAKT